MVRLHPSKFLEDYHKIIILASLFIHSWRNMGKHIIHDKLQEVTILPDMDSFVTVLLVVLCQSISSFAAIVMHSPFVHCSLYCCFPTTIPRYSNCC